MSIALLFLNRYKKEIGMFFGLLICVAVIYYYVSYIPNKLENKEIELKQTKEDLKAAKADATLKEDITKGKGVIDARVQDQISTVRSKPVPRHTIVIRAGRVLPPLSTKTDSSN